jgi:PIN domain nuclease of toxin-antitoxin system
LKLLLDANAFIWAYARPTELSPAARRALGDVANDRFVSIASLWEIAIKMSIGKLDFVENLAQALDDIAAASLPITLEHVARVRSMPFHHRDPFDRMMIAQAIEEDLTIVTRDRRVSAYGVPVLTA